MRKTLKSLKCTRFLVVLADSFPYLQELGIEGSGRINRPRFGTRHVMDQGIRAISLQLESLLSLNACSQKHLTPPSFQYLSSDCPLICDLHASFSGDCPVGLDFVLTSFSVPVLPPTPAREHLRGCACSTRTGRSKTIEAGPVGYSMWRR